VTSNASGLASTGTFAANATGGVNYSVSATASGGTNPSVNFTLTNIQTPTLSATLDGANNLVIADTDPTGKNNNLTAVVSGANIVITDANETFAPSAIPGAVLSNGNKTLTVPFASIGGTQVIFNTAGGNDTLVMDLSGGTFLKQLVFNGGSQTAGSGDGLRVAGSGTQTATYKPDATTTGNGTVTTSAGTISFTGLEPVDLTGMATATLNLPGGADVLSVVNGFDLTGPGTNAAIVVSGTSGGVAIESAAFWNNTTVVIDTVTGGSDGNDTITINSANNAHNNTNLTISTGTGTDVVNVNGPVSFAGAVSVTTVNVN